jgi:sugar/nucleoside kinase (ribokinase family)
VNIVVVGSVAFDSVETPFGKAEEVLGGSATYFSAAASFFTDLGLVAVVGDDFLDEHTSRLNKKGVDLRGLNKVHLKA